jgi:hypothetical protein
MKFKKSQNVVIAEARWIKRSEIFNEDSGLFLCTYEKSQVFCSQNLYIYLRRI